MQVKYISFFILFVSVLFVFPTIASAQVSNRNHVRTTTQYVESTKSADIQIYPYLSGDKKRILLDFQSKNLDKMEYIYYNLNYDTDMPETIRGVEGKFIPEKKDFKYFSGIPYVRRELIIGTCSGKVCHYDANPRKFNFTVKSKLKNAKSEVVTVMSIKY